MWHLPRGRLVGSKCSLEARQAPGEPLKSTPMCQKRLLVVAHDESLRKTRLALLTGRGYALDLAISNEEALTKLRTNTYDLILIGRDTRTEIIPLDRRIAEMGQALPVLKIDDAPTAFAQLVGASPEEVLAAIEEALRHEVSAQEH